MLVEGFAQPLRMIDPGVGFKKHPSNYFTHRPIDAALALREEHAIDPAQIESVEVVFPRFEYVNRPLPETGLDGKFSVQYTTAVALLDGEVTVDSFTNERRFAPDVAALLPRVKLIVDDAIPNDFDRMHAVVTVAMKNGDAAFETRRQALRLDRSAAHARAAHEEVLLLRAPRARSQRRPIASSSSSRTWMRCADVRELMDRRCDASEGVKGEQRHVR